MKSWLFLFLLSIGFSSLFSDIPWSTLLKVFERSTNIQAVMLPLPYINRNLHKNCIVFSLALNESIDITNISQLTVFSYILFYLN